jgi:methylthioribose-1-phosphate isomerase
LSSGKDIPIEERKPEEITFWFGKRVAPEGIKVYNPAFDVTPARFITAIITEAGLARPPYRQSLKKRVDRGIVKSSKDVQPI